MSELRREEQDEIILPEKSFTAKDLRKIVNYLRKNYYSLNEIKNIILLLDENYKFRKDGKMLYEMKDGRILDSLRK